MSTTKYIINSGTQSISGNLLISGDLNITGTVSTSVGVYRALLTHTGVIVGDNLMSFNLGLIKGETYTITNYADGDDFSNIANIQSPGTINATGSVFIATGEIPNVWSNYSQLTSSGNLVSDVLENTLGFDIIWISNAFGPGGYYIGLDSNFGPMYNRFPRTKTDIKVENKYSYDSPGFLVPLAGFGNMNSKDSYIFIDMYSPSLDELVSNSLYYTPVEIRINKDLDTTPITVYGINVSSFPYGNISIDILSGGINVESIYGDYASVNNIDELVIALNNDTITNYLGIFSVDKNVVDGLILTTTPSIKNQFSPNGTMSFEAFND